MNEENWRIPFGLKEAQKQYVSDPHKLLARAWAYRKQRSRAYMIYVDETPVGMALYYDLAQAKAYDFSQFFIDGGYQGRGYGEEADLYEKLGFRETGEVDEDEIVMVKEL